MKNGVLQGCGEKSFHEELVRRYEAARARYREALAQLQADTHEWQELKRRLEALEEKLAERRAALRERQRYFLALATILKQEGLLAPNEAPREVEKVDRAIWFADEGGEGEEAMTDVAYRVLQRYFPKGLHYRELERILREEENYEVPGEDPAANLLTHLTRDGRFERIGRGIYRVRAPKEPEG